MPPDNTTPPPRTEDAPYESEPPERLVVDVVVEDDGWNAIEDLEASVHQAAAAVADLAVVADQLPASACVAFTSDAAVRTLNRTYRAKDKPTNVLSFPSPEPIELEAGAVDFIGDIVLARETVFREAQEQGVPPRHHTQHLVVHGLLHLLGYDHETDADAETMEALEVAALAAIGVPDPYAGLE